MFDSAKSLLTLTTIAVLAAVIASLAIAEDSANAPTQLAPAGWRLVWGDEFDRLDDAAWHLGGSFAALNDDVKGDPTLVAAKDGILMVGSATDDPRSVGRVVAKQAQRFGRWEVRAKIPSATNAVIRLLPNAPWPSHGEIDIMTSRAHQHTITSSEFHWGGNSPVSHAKRSIPQQASVGGRLVSFPADYHTYAVEWTADQLRFYVDDVYHTVFYSDEVGDFLPKLTLPMHLALELSPRTTAKTSKDAEQSQKLLVDWVRLYEIDSQSLRTFVNGDFEEDGGSLSGWHVFGNRISNKPNIRPSSQQFKHGGWSLCLAGQSNGEENYSGVSQGVDVREGQIVSAKLYAKTSPRMSSHQISSRATMKLEFYNRLGDYFGGPAMVDFKEIVIADQSIPVDQWRLHELTRKAPAGAVEARLSLVFAEAADERGQVEVYVDDVELVRQDAK